MHELLTATNAETGETLHRELIDGDPDYFPAKLRRIRARVAAAHGLPVEGVRVDSAYTTATSMSDIDVESRNREAA